MENSLPQGQGQWSKVGLKTLSVGRLLDKHPEKLIGSKFDTPEDLDAFSQRFDEGVKRIFSTNQTTQHVKFGSPRDNDPECGIKAGRLALAG